MSEKPRFCRDCAFMTDPLPWIRHGLPMMCVAPEASDHRDLVSGAPRSCRALRDDADTCGRAAKWFKPKEDKP